MFNSYVFKHICVFKKIYDKYLLGAIELSVESETTKFMLNSFIVIVQRVTGKYLLRHKKQGPVMFYYAGSSQPGCAPALLPVLLC